ncbi:MAG: glycoside hydrolase family 28 protein [Lachnospiraceae bacterium]|nr:glycoside hydrolase family 28 protein [Lachnospiraceae bacterium]
MELKLLFNTARSATIEINDGGKYHTQKKYRLTLNGEDRGTTDVVITNLFGLKPDEEYTLKVYSVEAALENEIKAAEESDAVPAGRDAAALVFRTFSESFTLNVRAFGAKGDGETDDTLAIQTAINSCPPDGRVLVPKGVYMFTCLFLRSGLKLELMKDAVLKNDGRTDRLPLLPGVIQSYDEKSEYILGSWEGNPLDQHVSLITGIGVHDVVLYGEGKIDGNASVDGWWHKSRIKASPFRPKMLFLNHCENVRLQGLLFANSPCWTLHPYFSKDLAIYGTEVHNPADSPNTDGIDPESVDGLLIYGAKLYTGDDCVAIKSGKIYMGRTYKTPSRNITIRHSLLRRGHGSITVGSEIAGGAKNVLIESCVFDGTDRGLRIKTRRGRGRDSVIDDITFRDIEMDDVLTPVVVNSFYYCDPDGHSSYVQNRELMPVDARTPEIGRLTFENIDCRGCHAAAAWIDGLPEKKIGEIVMRDVRVTFADDARPSVPAMAEGIDACCRAGLHITNAKSVVLENVRIFGYEGEEIVQANVDEIKRK